MSRILASIALILAGTSPVLADSDFIPPVTDTLTLEECSACHMAYPPGLLPAESWSAIMGDLGNHFGENAELDEQTRSAIEAYLVDHASRRLKLADGASVPLRISELSWFSKEHDRKVSSRQLERAGSMSNCAACHRGAEKGYFEDD